MPSETVRVTEARRVEALPGDRTIDEFRTLISDALKEKLGPTDGYLWLRDCTDTWAVYELEQPDSVGSYRIEFTVAADGAVTFTGDPTEVEVRTSYEPVAGQVTEALRVESGRVLEAKGTDAAGGRVFAVQIIAAGTSKNGVRYPAGVLEAAAPLYEGAKAFDHHRTMEELRTSTVAGLVGHYENVATNAAGITADLHLLRSAGHIAEALDASIQAQDRGLPPVVGISHDVQAALTPAVEGGRRIQEATAITAVLSADVVADPSAGGRATRVVAGGIGSDPQDPSRKDDPAMTLKELLALLRAAKAEDRASLLEEHADVVTASGYTPDEVSKLADVVESPEAPGGAAETKPAEAPPAPAAEDTDSEPVLVAESYMGRATIREAVAAAGLDEGMIPTITDMVGKRFTEAQLSIAVGGIKRVTEGLERAGLGPKVPHLEVGEEDRDKKVARLDATFAGNYADGYTSIKEAYFDLSPDAARAFRNWNDPDLAHAIIRECWASVPAMGRTTESISTSTFAQALGDSMRRRVIAAYNGQSQQEWRKIVSSIAPLSDFRTQHIVRVGGYGEIPVVPERAPYQPLTTPDDEEVTYGLQKRGGTEDYSWESVLADDMRILQQIPTKMGRAAAKTLQRAIFKLLSTNPTIYDSVALFHATHANTDNPAVLSDSTLDAARTKMATQIAYGDDEPLGTQPKYLLVPPALRTPAIRLTTSAVAIPSSGSSSDVPNTHTDIEAIVVPEFTDANDWFLVGDPADIPTIEVGFLGGRQDPELFVNDDPKVGSVFNADIITWKIRHSWGLAVLDYRGFYRGAN